MNVRRLFAWQPFAPWVVLAAAGVAILLVTAIVLHVMNGAREAAEARVGAEMGQARAKAGADAGLIVDDAHAAQTASEDLTRKNADAIRNSKGADQALDPAVLDAARRGMCNRASYRDRPECVQLLGPRQSPR
jgi:hypothetical protein